MKRFISDIFSLKSDFSKNVFTLISGVFIAQLIPFVISPVLSRIFTMEDFGEYAIFNSILGVLAILSTARFEYAIALPDDHDDGLRILKIILVLTLSVSISSFLIFLFLRKPIADLLNIKKTATTLLFIPLTLVFIGFFQGLTFWFNRLKNYRLQAISKLTVSVGQSSGSLLTGFLKFGSFGLILSFLVGQFSGFITLFSNLKKKDFECIRNTDASQLKELATRYRKFPGFMMLGGLLNSFSSQLPVLMITSMFSTQIVGAMSFAQTMIVVPTGLISTAFADMLRQRAVEDFRQHGSCRPLLLSTLKKLFFIGLIPFTILFIVAPSLFSLFFGSEWRLAGEFARIMTLMFFTRFVFMSVSGTVIIISEKLEYDILWQIGYLLSIVLAIVAGNYFFADIKKVLLLMTLISSVFYLISFLMAYRFSIATNEQKA